MHVKKQGTYCLRYKKRIDNKSIAAKQVVNKLMSPKSICADCGAKRSVFVKDYNPNKKKNFFSQVRKTCKIVKNTQVTHFQKKIVLISRNKVKGKSKCIVCLTERTFIYEIKKTKYDLESELEIYLQFFTDVMKKHANLLRKV